MEAISALIGSGSLGVVESILVCVIGVLVYFVFIKQKNSENYMNNTIAGMQTLLHEEKEQTQFLAKEVTTIRTQMELEKEKTYQLREEILVLKNENIRLQNLVTQMEALVQQYKEEIEVLRKERGDNK